MNNEFDCARLLLCQTRKGAHTTSRLGPHLSCAVFVADVRVLRAAGRRHGRTGQFCKCVSDTVGASIRGTGWLIGRVTGLGNFRPSPTQAPRIAVVGSLRDGLWRMAYHLHRLHYLVIWLPHHMYFPREKRRIESGGEPPGRPPKCGIHFFGVGPTSPTPVSGRHRKNLVGPSSDAIMQLDKRRSRREDQTQRRVTILEDPGREGFRGARPKH